MMVVKTFCCSVNFCKYLPDQYQVLEGSTKKKNLHETYSREVDRETEKTTSANPNLRHYDLGSKLSAKFTKRRFKKLRYVGRNIYFYFSLNCCLRLFLFVCLFVFFVCLFFFFCISFEMHDLFCYMNV